MSVLTLLSVLLLLSALSVALGAVAAGLDRRPRGVATHALFAAALVAAGLALW